MKDYVTLTLKRAAYWKIAKAENDLDSYYPVGNTNTQRREKEISAIMKNRNSADWSLISTSTAIVDTKNLFSNLYLFEKILINTIDIWYLSQVDYLNQKLLTH